MESGARGLSQQDAFFVAYQEESAVSMQLGGTAELSGELRQEDLQAVVVRLVERWPYLGQTVHRRVLGLVWRGAPDPAGMLMVGSGGPPLDRWHNTPIDPFREPPLQIRWIPSTGGGTLAFRAHHSALDGQSFLLVTDFVLRTLAGGDSGGLEAPWPLPRKERPGFARPADLWRSRGRLSSMWRYMRWLKRESRRGRSAHLAVQETAPGDIAVQTRRIEGAARDRLRAHARSLGVQLPWLCCAAWIRAIAAWNVQRGEGNAWVSLEVPVSTRRSRSPRTPELGNGISPLVLSARADRSLGDVARDLRAQFITGVRQRSHLAVPLLTAGGRYLPWWLFRRLAADTAFSGFATSHFTWMRSPTDLHAEVGLLSGRRLELLSYEAYGPVCLHMGAAVLMIETPMAFQLSMTHRLNALPPVDASSLADLLLAELLPAELSPAAQVRGGARVEASSCTQGTSA